MKKRKRLLIILLAVLLVLIALFFLVGNYFYAFALTPRRGERAPGVPEGEVAGTSEDAARIADRQWFDTHDVALTEESYDGLRLRAYQIDSEGHRYAIIVHGYTGDARSMAGFGKAFHDRGFTVLLPDCRAHGESEGDAIGMGWPDRLDVLTWVDHIIAGDPEAEILLFGISMGGATVMMAAGEPLPENVRLIIEDCGYSSVWEEFRVQLREQFGLPAFPVLNAASTVTKLRAGYWFSEADAVKQVAKATVPMLFIHGEEDTFVPFAMLQPLYDAKPGIKEKLVIPSAGHGAASAVDPATYWEAVDTFIDAHM